MYLTTSPKKSNIAQITAFKGLNAAKIVNVESLKNISRCKLDGLAQSLSEKAGADVVEIIDNTAKLIKPKNGVLTQIKELPLDIASYFSKKFHFQSDFLSRYSTKKEQKAFQLAANGFYEYGERFIKEGQELLGKAGEELKLGSCIATQCNEAESTICSKVQKDFVNLLDNDFKPGNSSYNTRDERTLVKFFTGLVSSLWLFLDFHNNSVRDGKVGKDTNKEAREKFAQEMKETAGETAAQFVTLGGLSGWVNNSTIAAPLLNAATSLFFRITSRLSSHKPLTPIKEKIESIFKPVSFNEFQEAAKKGEQINASPIAKKPKEKEKKKHILTFKNIAIWFGASVLGGYAIKFATPKAKQIAKDICNKIKTKPFVENIAGKVKELTQKHHDSIYEPIKMNAEQLGDFLEVLEDSGKNKLSKQIKDIYLKQLQETSEVALSECKKMTHIPFTKIPVSKKELFEIPFIPFKILKGAISFPYELVSKAVDGVMGKKLAKKATKDEALHIANLFRDFLEQKNKFANKSEQEFIEHYKKHLEKHWVNALNRVTRSNVDNTDIGKLTQIFGTTASIYFSCTDDYNRTMRQTNDKELAKHDARKRGVNKFAKIVTQLPIINIVNHALDIPYGKTLFGATVISMGVTFITEAVAHFLAGMPLKKLDTQEEYKEYQDKHKNGAMRWYYKLIDKITA